MQVYICVICMANKPPLFCLSAEHRKIFEAVLSPAMNLDPLRSSQLLTCGVCKQLILTVQKFQATALIGVRHLLSLLALVQRTPAAPPDPLQLAVKQEPEENSLLTAKSFIEIPLKEENNTAPPPVEAAVKAEPGSPERAACAAYVEVSVPAAPASSAQLPLGAAVGAAGTAPRQSYILAAALSGFKSVSTTFSHRRPVCASAGSGGDELNKMSLQTLLQRTVTVPPLQPQPSPGSSAPAARGPPAGPPQPQVPAPPPSSPWYVRVLKEAELQAELRAARGAAHFAHARLRCEPCALAFGSQDEAERHAALHLPSAGEYECQTCTQRLPTLAALSAHRAAHAVRYFCYYCRYSTADCAAVMQHACDAKNRNLESANVKKDAVKKPRKRYPTPFKCKICYYGFPVEASLTRHMNKHHKTEPEPQTCNVCGKTLKSMLLLKRHMYVHKEKAPRSIDDLRPEQYCVECELHFATPSGYRQHMKSLKHSTKDNWRFQCDDCGNKFASKCKVELHIQMVHNKDQERPFKCENCPKSFMTAPDLRRHAETHAPGSRPRKHVCHLCGKAFTVKKSLVEHLLMHAGARPHACAQCGATFTFKAALYTHNRLKHLHIKRSWRKKPRKPKKGQKGKEEPEVAVESLEDSTK